MPTIDEVLEKHLAHARPKEDKPGGPDVAWLMRSHIVELKDQMMHRYIDWLFTQLPGWKKKYKVNSIDALMKIPAAVAESDTAAFAYLQTVSNELGVSPTGIYKLAFKKASSGHIFPSIVGGDANKRFDLPAESVLQHDALNGIDETLEHHGVKGQKWGVTHETSGSTSANSSSAMRDPKTMTAGRRMVERAKGDRTFWQRSAAIAAVSGAALAAAALAPAALPASVVLAAGGPTLVSAKIALGSGLAIRGAQIQNSVAYRQRFKARIAHADSGDGSVGAVYDAMTQPQKDVTAVLAYSFNNRIEFKDDQEVQDVWATMTPEQRAVALFLANVSDTSEDTVTHSDIVTDVLEHHGIRGQKWGVRRKTDSSTGLVARTASADQIHADRIKSKIAKGGTAAVSNRDLKDFAARINAEQEFNRAAASAEAQKSSPFIVRFMKTQGNRQFNRVADKAVDIAVEKALESAGIRVGKKHKGLGGDLAEISNRIKPKKKGKPND